MQVLVPQPVVSAQGSEAVLVLVPAAVEVHAAVDRDVLHHRPAALLHGAVDGDGRVSGADQIQAVPRLTAGALPQIITVPGKLWDRTTAESQPRNWLYWFMTLLSDSTDSWLYWVTLLIHDSIDWLYWFMTLLSDSTDSWLYWVTLLIHDSINWLHWFMTL